MRQSFIVHCLEKDLGENMRFDRERALDNQRAVWHHDSVIGHYSDEITSDNGIITGLPSNRSTKSRGSRGARVLCARKTLRLTVRRGC